MIVAVVLLLRLRRLPKEKKQQTADDQSSIQKNKKRKHFGFSKSKNKKNNADAEEALNLELLEKKGKKKAKSKAKAAGKKKAAQRAAESHQEMESDRESLAAEEDNDQNREDSDGEESADTFAKEPVEKPVLTAKQQVRAAVKPQPDLGTNLSGKSDDGELEKSEGKKKAKKTRPRKEGEDELKKQTSVDAKQTEMTLVIEEKENVPENWKTRNANHDSSPEVIENGDLESSAVIGSKAAKKKKKKNKNNANADLAHAAVGVSQADEDRQDVSAEVTVGKLVELEEEDVENGFVRVTQDLPIPKVGDARAEEVATTPSESESEKALKAALEAEILKCRVLEEQCDGERHQNEFLKKALEQMSLQIQEKETKKMKLERSLEQLSHELKTLNAQLGDNASVVQKLRDENQALKEALAKAQQHAVDEAQKVELQQRVRVMDDALKQNALQLNSIDNARKDLESREKRHLERIVNFERELQASKSEVQRLTLEMAQVEKMRTRYRELEKQKADLDRVLETRNTEFINYGRTKDSELQRLQSEKIEISRMNETFQRRSRELEARASDRDALAAQVESLRQQLCVKDTELQVLIEREAQLAEKETFERKAMELQGYMEQNLRLEKERELGQKEAEFLQKEASLSRRIQELESQDAGRSNVKELEDELSSCRAQTQQLVANEVNLLKEVDRLKQELSAVQIKSENLDELKIELSKQVNQLRSDSDAKANQVAQVEWEKQELKDEVSKLQASLGERDANAESFAQVQADMNQRLERALLMQQELDKQKKENTVLRDEIEQMRSELLQRLADNDAQLRQELEEKVREIERLKSQNTAAGVICESQDKTYNETGLLQDSNTQQNRQEEMQFDAQNSPEAGRGQ